MQLIFVKQKVGEKIRNLPQEGLLPAHGEIPVGWKESSVCYSRATEPLSPTIQLPDWSGAAGKDGKAAELGRKEPTGPGASPEDSAPGPVGGTAECTVGGQLKGLPAGVSSARGGPSEAGEAGGGQTFAPLRGADSLSTPAAAAGLPVSPPRRAGTQAARGESHRCRRSSTASVVVADGANGGVGVGGAGGISSLSSSSLPNASAAGRVTDEPPVEKSVIVTRCKPTGNVINSEESIEQPPPPVLPVAAALNGGEGELTGKGTKSEGLELGRNRLEEEEKEAEAAAAAEVTSREAGEGGTMVEKTAEVGEAAPAATPPSSGSVADIGSSPPTGAGEGGSTPTTAEQGAAPPPAAASTGSPDHVSPVGPLSSPIPAKKHPLYNHWTLWYDAGSSGGGRGGPGGRQAAWGSTLRQVYSFGFVEDFWCMYNNIKPPSDLRKGTDLHMFKRNVEPKWEDPVCEKGGKWTVASPAKQVLDAFWLNTLLALIGEQFDEGNDICGVVVNIRDKDRISLWTSTATNEVRQMSIGKQWKVVLDLNEKSMMGFTAHEDAKSGGRSKNKELYYI
ncbi:hypothetical protein CBR_g41160 [Chara braunii]|uniref:eIF-4F 25 kDa subunit n=1 Tax=Chara braunii TaxID=69332 RepID=A0A388K2J8_CHABU|nr:hypothetical protein CBR_g41160 [Chara braunii]|eukprot:GBG64239.1 hypothetical protein CBR_g41160 [Chara braunii]